jgi:hypothetical protein
MLEDQTQDPGRTKEEQTHKDIKIPVGISSNLASLIKTNSCHPNYATKTKDAA